MKRALLVLVMVLAGCGVGDEGDGDAKRAALSLERQEIRAYAGAPPTIPHQVEELGREDCLACHAGGDAQVEGHELPAPVTPHPRQLNCRQCHVPQQVNGVFRASTLEGLAPWDAPPRAHPLGPPYIPHRVQDREECVVCHLGASSSPALRPEHGVRVNCRQCHLQLQQAVEPFRPSFALQ